MKKKLLSVVLTAAMAASLAACGGSGQPENTATTAAPAASAAEDGAKEEAGDAAGTEAAGADLPSFEGQQLRISTFSFNAELVQKNIYDPFMEATGCELIVDTGKNAERVTKIKESPENYDIVVIGDAFIADLIDADLIDTIDTDSLSNLYAVYDLSLIHI